MGGPGTGRSSQRGMRPRRVSESTTAGVRGAPAARGGRIVKIEFPYTRTTGPVIGPFLTGLRDGQIVGNRCGDRVLCPPLEYDPDTAAPLDGRSSSRSARAAPSVRGRGWPSRRRSTRSTHPFAFALISSTAPTPPMVHAIDAGSIDAMSTRHAGHRAVPRRAPRARSPTSYFVPEAAARRRRRSRRGERAASRSPSTSSRSRSASRCCPHRERFAEGLLDGKIIGQTIARPAARSYVPGRGYDNLERVPLHRGRRGRVSDRGTVSVVHGDHAGAVLRPEGDRAVHPGVDPARRHRLSRSSVSTSATSRSRSSASACACRRCGGRRASVDVTELDNRWGGAWEHVIDRWEPTANPTSIPRTLKEYSC